MEPTTQTAKTLDYSSLTAPVSEQERQEFRRRDGKTGTGVFWIVAAVVSVFALVFPMLLLGPLLNALSVSGEGQLLIGVLTWGVVTALGIWAVRALQRQRLNKLVRLDRFAHTNGMTFAHDFSDFTRGGMIFDEGHSRVVNESLILADGTELADYTYVTGSGKNQTTHTWSFVRVPLERAVPHMVLDAKSNNLFGKLSNLTDTFDKDQTLSLEGDFDNHFTLYAPREYERDALYIFTPDVMASLIDNGNGYDMEAIGQELYIYKNGHINLLDANELHTLLGIVDTISSELRSQTKRYADERVGDKTMNVIAPQGAKLKHGVNWVVIGVFVLFISYQIAETFFMQQNASFAPFVITAVIVGSIVSAIVLFSKRRT